MHTISYEFLMKPEESARCHQTLSSQGGGGGGGRTSSKRHVKKLHSMLRYAERSRGFTEIKQVNARNIQVCRGSMGFNAWNTFVLRVEHPYIQKVREIPGYG